MRVGGNLGAPALDLLEERAELYVLELSSFQLETTESLPLAAAAVLNVTPDHLDRYADLDAYAAAKARIFAHCERRGDQSRRCAGRAPCCAPGQRRLSFSLRADVGADYALGAARRRRRLADAARRAAAGARRSCKLTGLHNAANALAALALGEALALPRAACLAALREFAGLPHRTQWVADIARRALHR